MMTSSRWPLAIALSVGSLLLAACGSVVPLGEAGEAGFDAGLVGRWQLLDDEDGPDELLVLKFDETAYFAEYRDDEEIARFRVYLTDIDGVPFLNAQYIDDLEEDERRYFFFTYRITDEGDLVLTPLDSVDGVDIEKFETTEALATFVRAHLNDDRLYGESGWFRRMADE